jgi:hypothetical protein
MKIKNEKPPIWASVKKLLDFNEKTTVFTYGDTVYNPAGAFITNDILVHESVHELQQNAMNVLGKFGAFCWWKKFLKDPQFRLAQETEAYQAQYQFVSHQMKDREKLNKYLIHLAAQLSGIMYGRVIGFTEAMRRIKLSPGAETAR